MPTASGRFQLRLPASCTMSYDVFPASGAAAQRSRFDFEDDTVAETVSDKLNIFYWMVFKKDELPGVRGQVRSGDLLKLKVTCLKKKSNKLFRPGLPVHLACWG